MRPLATFVLASACLAACTGRATGPTPTASSTAALETAAGSALSPELQVYLDEALALIEENSIYGGRADWAQLRAFALDDAAGAKTTADLYPALRLVLGATGDRHGYVMPPSEAESYFESRNETPPAVKQEIVQGRLGYVAVPTFSFGAPPIVRAMASELQEAIQDLDAASPCGWLVDVRYNEGGNGAAMIAGVAPILGDGTYVYAVYPDGHRAEWHYREGTMYLDDVPVIELGEAAYRLRQPDPPVAVLTNEVTTSAGELVAMAFRGRPGARSFGQPTLGRTTAPQGFPLSDGAILGVSVARFADRTGQVYEDKVVPDRRIVAHDSPAYRSRDVPGVAIEWLFNQPACAPRP